MLPHRKEPLIQSVPVSRVASTQRLNQLSPATIGSPGNSVQFSSRPSTPVPYVPSSLNPNPTRLFALAPNSNSSAYDEKFEKLPIVEKLVQFEQSLTTLSSDITSFRDSDDRIQQTVQELIKLNDSIYSDILQVEVHQKLGAKIKTLKEEKGKLDSTAKDALKELIQYRSQLKELPTLPTVSKKSRRSDNNHLVDIKEILKYAMKLSKFTKIPPSAVEFPQQVHPNNYIWPAEDSLRRGMLAISSLRGEELIQTELKDTEEKPEEEIKSPEAISQEQVAPVERAPAQHSEPRHSQSAPSYDQPTAPQTLDLDLFDEDDLSD